MASPDHTVLISGANRGLGKGLLELYLAKPNHTVIAFNRDPSSASSKELLNLPKGNNSNILIVKCDASIEQDPFKAVQEIQKQGITHLDTVIANAGIALAFPAVKDLKISDLQEHLIPNVFGVISLYQASRELLLKGKQPKWVTMGSSAGWITKQLANSNGAYGPTKAAVHWLTKRIDAEEEHITSWVMDPGWVQTDMGNFGAASILGPGRTATLDVETSVVGMEKFISIATKETHGGGMWGWDGEKREW